MTQQVAYLEAVVGADITNFRSGMRQVRSDLGILSDTVGGIGHLGRNLTYAVTAPLLAMGGAAVKSASDFDASMRNINSIIGLGEEQFSALEKQVLDFAATTRAGVVPATNALYEVFSAGVTDIPTAMAIWQTSTKVAEAGLADLESTTNALTATISAYGLEASDATRVGNVWTRMVQLGVGSLDDFLSNSQKILPLSNALGVSLEDMGASVAFLSQGGGGAAKAETAFAMMLSNLLKPTEALTAAYDRLGVATGTELIDKFGSVGGAIMALRQATDDPLEFNKFFSKTGLEAALRMTDNFDQLNESIIEFNSGLDSATTDAWNEQAKSFAMQWDLMVSAVQGFMTVIGQQLLPMITPLIQGFTEFIQNIAQTSPELIRLGIAVAGVAAAIGPLLWLLSGLISIPGLIIGAIAGLALAFDQNFGGIRDTVTNSIGPILNDLQTVEDGINDFFALLQGKDPNQVDWSQFGMLPMPTSDQDTAMSADKQAYDESRQFQIPFDRAAAWAKIKTGLEGLWQDIGNWIITTAIPGIDAAGGNILQGLADSITASTAEFSAGENAISNAFQALLDGNLTVALNTIAPGLGDKIGGMFSGLQAGDVLPGISSGLSALTSAIGTWLVDTGLPTLANMVGSLIGSIPSLITSGIETTGDISSAIAKALFGGGEGQHYDPLRGEVIAADPSAFAKIVDSFVSGFRDQFQKTDWGAFVTSIFQFFIDSLTMFDPLTMITNALMEMDLGAKIQQGFQDAIAGLTSINIQLPQINLLGGVATADQQAYDAASLGVDPNATVPDFSMPVDGGTQNDVSMRLAGKTSAVSFNTGMKEALAPGGEADLSTTITDAFSGISTSLGDGSPAKTSITDFATGVNTNLQSVAATGTATSGLFSIAMGLMSVAATIAIGAINSKLTGLVGLLTAATSAANGLAGALGGITGATGGTTNLAGARADGGSVFGKQNYLVGEDGPEIFTPQTSGTIIPNDVLRSDAQSGGTTESTVNHITVQNTMSVDDFLFEMRRRGIRLGT